MHKKQRGAHGTVVPKVIDQVVDEVSCAAAPMLAVDNVVDVDLAVSGGSSEVPAVSSQGFPASDAGASDVLASPSPNKNRERFLANCQPLRVCCNLSTVGLTAAGVRFSFQAIVFVVYPASFNPDRRHVLLIDEFGCTGMTVWGAHVPLFNFTSVGSVVKFTKLSMVSHNGKKQLSMGKDTTVVFLPAAVVTEESKWWNSLASKAPLRIIDVHDRDDDTIVNVAGIVGMLQTETKKVRSDSKDLLNIRLTDRTGFLDVRSWNHSEGEFSNFLEKPLMLQRVRVTSFGGVKICELLDGPGTIVVPEFPGKPDLESYWAE